MADPHITPTMDWLDKLTVILYRLGFTLSIPVIALLPWELGFPNQEMVFLSAILCASCLHIYMKSFRLLLQMATWVSLALLLFGFSQIALGGAFITLGGLCVKEYFCFKIPALPAQPLLLAILWFSLQLEWLVAAKVVATISSLLFLLVTIAKWRMPLHFDIGDKSKYEI